MDPNSSESSEDVQTDAQPDSEENDVASARSSTHNESALGARPKANRLSDIHLNVHTASLGSDMSSSQQSSLAFTQSAKPFTPHDDNDYGPYLAHMPAYLQEDNIDILIICADNDREAATSFQKHLKKDILFYIHDHPRTPRVKRLDQVVDGSMDNLDLAFSKALYVFLYVTEEFCAEPWALLQGQACLTEAIHDQKKKWCVVPIHTAPRRSQRYKLPMMLNSLRPINYWSGGQDQFYIEGVRKLLELKTGVLLERDRLLDSERHKYFIQNRPTILLNASYAKTNQGTSKSTVSHVPETSKASSAPSFCPTKAREVSTRMIPIYNDKSSTACTSDVISNTVTHFSLPDYCSNKAVKEENVTSITDRLEQTVMSEEVTVPHSNVLNVSVRGSAIDVSERTGRGILQQQESSVAHHHNIEQTNLLRTTFSDHSGVVQQSAPAVSSHSSADEGNSSIVTDGPINEEPPPFLRQQNSAGLNFSRNTSHPLVSSSAHTGSAMPAATDAQYVRTAVTPPVYPAPLRMQHPAGYAFQGHGTYNSVGMPVYAPGFPYRGMQPQVFYPVPYVSDPNLYDSVQSQQFPSVPHYNMQDLYSLANPFPQGYFYQTPSSQYSDTAPSASHCESSRISTEMNAPHSFRSSLPHSLSMGMLNVPASFPGMSYQYPLPFVPNLFQQQLFPQITSQFLASAPVTRPWPTGDSPASFHQHQWQQLRTAAPSDQGPMTRGQPGTGGTVSSSEAQPSAESAGALPSGVDSSATSIIKHIHHHHHQKTVNVTKATNVLIGNKSKFLNKNRSSDTVTNDDDDDDDVGDDDDNDDSEKGGDSDRAAAAAPGGESRVPDPASQGRSGPGTRSISGLHGTHGGASGVSNVCPGNSQTGEVAVGFAELSSHLSTREPVEKSELGDVMGFDDASQTYCKKL